jgi:hypothetical protein
LRALGHRDKEFRFMDIGHAFYLTNGSKTKHGMVLKDVKTV